MTTLQKKLVNISLYIYIYTHNITNIITNRKLRPVLTTYIHTHTYIVNAIVILIIMSFKNTFVAFATNHVLRFATRIDQKVSRIRP